MSAIVGSRTGTDRPFQPKDDPKDWKDCDILKQDNGVLFSESKDFEAG